MTLNDFLKVFRWIFQLISDRIVEGGVLNLQIVFSRVVVALLSALIFLKTRFVEVRILDEY